ncbi:hypothetical protein AVO45_03005 [Ruegeria marisrubri]|uniref:Uncharacterized protein n=1 Tax=Ruegeria marisrubri TaxID=1685379 RepID=A0A101CYZ2_9RHOB|nr:hypothetical protein AVO45_03005 [Ruegeria marisrubri]
MGTGAGSWDEVAEIVVPPRAPRRALAVTGLANALKRDFNQPPAAGATRRPAPTTVKSHLETLLDLCPCLVNQMDAPVSARAVVHLCELTLGARISSANIGQAFAIQRPSRRKWRYPPFRVPKAGVGDISELLCSDLLTNEGVPRMELKHDKWPDWQVPGHALMNKGALRDLRALGDILIPCAPTNLLISVKTESARERLLYSANSIEGIGFGFFNQADEFVTRRRIQLFKRMGFSAISMPDDMLRQIEAELARRGEDIADVQNIYGTRLYRPHSVFTSDMRRVVGRSAFDL